MGWLEDVYKIVKDFFSSSQAPMGVASGVVKDTNGAEQSDVAILFGAERKTKSAGDGSFSIELAAKTYEVSLEYKGQIFPTVTSFYVKQGEEKSISLTLPIKGTGPQAGPPADEQFTFTPETPELTVESQPEGLPQNNPEGSLKDWIHEYLDHYKQTHGEWPSDIICCVFRDIENNMKALDLYQSFLHKNGTKNQMIGSWVADHTEYDRGHSGNPCSSRLVGSYTALYPPRSIKVTPQEADEPKGSVLPITSSYIQQEYQRFQADPTKAMQVEIRRYRAAQIRNLLSEPAQINAVTFDKEVWNSEKDTYVDGVSFPRITYPDLELSPEQIQEFEATLLAGKIKFAGNPAWNPGSNKYAPGLKDEEQRDKNIQEAITILNAEGRSPLQKVLDLQKIYGIGRGVSTGLVMLYYSSEMMTCNRQTKTALQTILDKGWFQFSGKTKKEEDFQRAAEELKNYLGAEDFLELDWFLYLVNVGQYCADVDGPDGSSTNT